MFFYFIYIYFLEEARRKAVAILSASTVSYDLKPARSHLRPRWTSSSVVIRNVLCKSCGVWK